MPYAADRFAQQPTAVEAATALAARIQASARPFPLGEAAPVQSVLAGPDAGSSFWGSAEPEPGPAVSAEPVDSYPAVLPNTPLSHDGHYLAPINAQPTISAPLPAEVPWPDPLALPAEQCSLSARTQSADSPQPNVLDTASDDFFAQSVPRSVDQGWLGQLSGAEALPAPATSDFFGSDWNSRRTDSPEITPANDPTPGIDPGRYHSDFGYDSELPTTRVDPLDIAPAAYQPSSLPEVGPGAWPHTKDDFFAAEPTPFAELPRIADASERGSSWLPSADPLGGLHPPKFVVDLDSATPTATAPVALQPEADSAAIAGSAPTASSAATAGSAPTAAGFFPDFSLTNRPAEAGSTQSSDTLPVTSAGLAGSAKAPLRASKGFEGAVAELSAPVVRGSASGVAAAQQPLTRAQAKAAYSRMGRGANSGGSAAAPLTKNAAPLPKSAGPGSPPGRASGRIAHATGTNILVSPSRILVSSLDVFPTRGETRRRAKPIQPAILGNRRVVMVAAATAVGLVGLGASVVKSMSSPDDSAARATNSLLLSKSSVESSESRQLVEASGTPQGLTAGLPGTNTDAFRMKAVARSAERGPIGDCDGKEPSATYGNGQIPSSELCYLPFAQGHKLRGDAAVQLIRLNAAFKVKFGEDLCLTDSYRSLSSQYSLAARKPGLAAKPGTSEHGLGLAIDMCDGPDQVGSARRSWFLDNAPDFGWENPAWAQPGGSRPEPWHWEFFWGR